MIKCHVHKAEDAVEKYAKHHFNVGAVRVVPRGIDNHDTRLVMIIYVKC